jgi:hypothetical protein
VRVISDFETIKPTLIGSRRGTRSPRQPLIKRRRLTFCRTRPRPRALARDIPQPQPAEHPRRHRRQRERRDLQAAVADETSRRTFPRPRPRRCQPNEYARCLPPRALGRPRLRHRHRLRAHRLAHQLGLQVTSPPPHPINQAFLLSAFLFSIRVLPVFYPCSTRVLPVFYPCSTRVLPVFYPYSIRVLSAFRLSLSLSLSRERERERESPFIHLISIVAGPTCSLNTPSLPPDTSIYPKHWRAASGTL